MSSLLRTISEFYWNFWMKRHLELSTVHLILMKQSSLNILIMKLTQKSTETFLSLLKHLLHLVFPQNTKILRMLEMLSVIQNPNEDTEWNDALRRHGILPAKEKELTEDEIVSIVEKTVEEKQNQGQKKLEDLSLDELDELEDEEDERILLEYRKKRIAEIQALAAKAKYGEVKEISAEDYVSEVNNAGEGVWVVLHLFKQGIPLCALLNQHLSVLAAKFPATKFLKSISTTCIPNFPDSNLPTIFVYYEGELVKQLIGAHNFRGMSITVDELEWILAEAGAVKTTLEGDPRPKIKDVLFSKLKEDDNNDW